MKKPKEQTLSPLCGIRTFGVLCRIFAYFKHRVCGASERIREVRRLLQPERREKLRRSVVFETRAPFPDLGAVPELSQQN